MSGKSDSSPRRQWEYPARNSHPDDEIFIYDKWCKSCGICYSLCPKGVLTADKAGRPVVSHPEECIACYLCEILCPDMAITVHKERAKKAARESNAPRPSDGEGNDDE